MELPIKYDDVHWTVRKQAREHYVTEQKGLCVHCNEPLTGDPIQAVQQAYINVALFPKGMFAYPVHLHHCRKTGLTVGAIHARCNAYLWQYRGE